MIIRHSLPSGRPSCSQLYYSLVRFIVISMSLYDLERKNGANLGRIFIELEYPIIDNYYWTSIDISFSILLDRYDIIIFDNPSLHELPEFLLYLKISQSRKSIVTSTFVTFSYTIFEYRELKFPVMQLYTCRI